MYTVRVLFKYSNKLMAKEEIKKSYWSVTPANVRYSKKIPDGAKLLYGEISALCNERGYCWASNDYFADLYGNDKRTIQRWVKALETSEFIYTEVKGKKRKIYLTQKFTFHTEGIEEPEEKEDDDQSTTTKKKKPAAKKKVIKVKYTTEDLELAQVLLDKVLFNFPALENKKHKVEDWADDIRKLREIDKATHEQIAFMIVWLHGGEVTLKNGQKKMFEPHDFWSKNILSAKKLRKQWFENLVPQLQSALMSAEKKKKPKQQTVGKL